MPPPSASLLRGPVGVASPSSVLRQLSFEAISSSNINSPFARSTRSSLSNRKLQGVLWKRRDVFKNRWRPRWFVLHPHQGVLTYYLLTNSNDHTSTSRDNGGIRDNFDAEADTDENNLGSNRRRTWSESSNFSEHSVDYDVVPRGTIYLLGGCTVHVNDQLTRPEENLYAFTIVSPTGGSMATTSPTSTSSKCHLAARTAEARTRWIRRIAIVCGDQIEEDEGDGRMMNDESALDNTTFPSTAEESSQATLAAPLSARKWSRMDDSVGRSSTTILENVPSQLAEKIDRILDRYLPLCNSESHYANVGWTQLVDSDSNSNEIGTSSSLADSTIVNGSWICEDPKDGLQIIKSTALLRGQNPRTVFNLLIDSTKRPLYETNIQSEERLQVYNPHVMIDYFAYHAVWPTSAREFAVAVHWQVVTRQSSTGEEERAIVVMGFSCDEANKLKPSQANFVRGNLKISMSLLRPIDDDRSDGKTSCLMTRILSYDLCGSIPLRLTNTVMLQQANLPRIVDTYLIRQAQHLEPTAVLTTTPLTNQDLVRGIVQPLLDSTRTRRGRRISFDDEDVPRMATNGAVCSTNEASSLSVAKTVETSAGRSATSPSASNTYRPSTEHADRRTPLKLEGHAIDHRPSLAVTSLVLLTPVLLYSCSRSNISATTAILAPCKELVFLASAWCAIRWVVLLHLGPSFYDSSLTGRLTQTNSEDLVATMTCRFSVDLKGVLRYIANSKEAREEDKLSSDRDISVTHIVVCALARALTKLRKEETVTVVDQVRTFPSRSRRVNIPWLCVDGVYQDKNDAGGCGIGISVLLPPTSASPTPSSMVTIFEADQKYRSVQAVANYLAQKGRRAASNSPPEKRPPWYMVLLSHVVPLFLIVPTSEYQNRLNHFRYGQCLVVATPDSSGHHGEIDIDVAVQDSNDVRDFVIDSSFQIVMVVSGVRLQPSDQQQMFQVRAANGSIHNGSRDGSTSSSVTGQGPVTQSNKKAMLSMSMTIRNVPVTRTHVCRKLAEDVQKFLQFPEMVDEN